MEQTKTDLVKQGTVSNQQALVNLLINKKVKPIKRVIPGGKFLLEQLDHNKLTQAVYNWLRGCRYFEEVTVSLAKDPDQWRTKEIKVVDFPDNSPHEIWLTHDKGRMYLAEIIAEVMKERKLVYLRAKKDGLYVAEDLDENFKPKKTATVEDVEAELAEKEGQEIYNDYWEPYVSFIPKNRSQYGR